MDTTDDPTFAPLRSSEARPHSTIYAGETFSAEETRFAEAVRDNGNPSWDAGQLAYAIRQAGTEGRAQ